jgi:hypothetical protein
MANENAAIGDEAERLFKNSIRKQTSVLTRLKQHFGIDGDFATSYKTGTDLGKTDVILRFSDGRTLNANIKAFKPPGFNQVTRCRIGAFCERFNLHQLIPMFESGVIRVATRRGNFISEEETPIIGEALSPIARHILQFSISNLENPELLVLYNRTSQTMYVYDLQAILAELNYDISVSKRGVIKIGRFFSIQRKGGDGNVKTHEKSSLAHPGNGLQVKMQMASFIAANVPIITFQPSNLAS